MDRSMYESAFKGIPVADLTLPPLPYGKDALASVISEQTLTFHYEKHHMGYLNNLKGLCADTPRSTKDLITVIQENAGSKDRPHMALFNNAAQVWNHTFYWNSMKPKGGWGTWKPSPETQEFHQAIETTFGSWQGFAELFTKDAMSQFGSGWVWLITTHKGELSIQKTSNAQVPWLTPDQVPLMVMDVWEHAYYLDFQNRRLDYSNAWTRDLMDVDFAANRYAHRKDMPAFNEAFGK